MPKKTKMTLNEAADFAKMAIDSVPSSWLKVEIGKIRLYKPPKNFGYLSYTNPSQRFHPLAFLIYQVDRFLTSSKGKVVPASAELLRLAHIGMDLSLLRQCAGIEKKISNLTSSSELFEKTVYEMRVAAAFLEDGHVVEFVETASEEGRQTPDLLVDNAVEVECTKKDAFTKRDIRNIENWQLITRRIGGIMNNAGANYGVMIKTQKDPDNKDVNFILVKSRELITTHKEGPFAYPERGIGITVRPLSKQDEEIKANSIQIGASEDTDFFVLDFDKMVNDSGSALIKNPKIFGFKCAEIPDRLKSVVESIKKKTKQLSGKRPGAIYVELNALDSHMVDVDFNRLDSLSKEVLRNNRTISAIAITAEVYSRDPQTDEAVYLHKARVIRNENAHLALKFKIAGET